MRLYYKLVGTEAKPCSLEEWAGFAPQSKGEHRSLWYDGVKDRWFVSTVFLGIDHSFGLGGPPILFESLVSTPENPDGELCRYTSYADAALMHKAMVATCIEKYGTDDNPVEGDTDGDKR